jgi:hypothetical protein
VWESKIRVILKSTNVYAALRTPQLSNHYPNSTELFSADGISDILLGMAQIGFRPAEERKWKLTLGARPGMIEETVTNGCYLYDWRSDDGKLAFGITQSETRRSNEEVEAEALKRAAEPAIGLIG